MDRVPDATATLMVDGDGNVARAELRVYSVALPIGQQTGTFPGRAVGRGWDLLGKKGNSVGPGSWAPLPWTHRAKGELGSWWLSDTSRS